MPNANFDFAIIGGGLLGLATAKALVEQDSSLQICILEKEQALAQHQSGRNSGVIHSGIYYQPGSFKQRLTAEGRAALFEFCDAEGVDYERCGKLLVAQNEEELPRMRALAENALKNGLHTEIIASTHIMEIEPQARGFGAIYLPEAAIVDYSMVAAHLAAWLQRKGVAVKHQFRVENAAKSGTSVKLKTYSEAIEAQFVINCAGLHSDRVARILGAKLAGRIVPFRGQYFHLQGDSKSLVRGLIYPLPDPRFPFLGVHLSRTISGEVIAGPNAVLSLKREGYQSGAFSLSDTWGTFSYPGFWRFALNNFSLAASQYLRAWNRAAFSQALQNLVPAVQREDLAPGRSGVRAQAMDTNGRLLKDFAFEESARALHVINAPSPGATASLAIGRHIAKRALAQSR